MIRSRGRKIGDAVIVFLCVILILICILPIINIAARSVSSADAIIKNQVGLWPVGFTLQPYIDVLSLSKYTYSLAYTAILTIIGTVLSLIMTMLLAFPLTYDNLPGRKFFNALALITMYFGAGTIPSYLLVKDLGMLNKPIALILPYCLSIFNMILMRSFFYGIPLSMREAAEIDGAGPLKVLTRVYLPLSKPVFATLALFYAVGRWNGYTDAILYVSQNEKAWPIQLLLYNLLNNQASLEIGQQEGFVMPGKAESVKAATVMFATIPILIIYPWLQRYFIAGVTLGAVKE